MTCGHDDNTINIVMGIIIIERQLNIVLKVNKCECLGIKPELNQRLLNLAAQTNES